jgi:hypothetical protein
LKVNDEDGGQPGGINMTQANLQLWQVDFDRVHLERQLLARPQDRHHLHGARRGPKNLAGRAPGASKVRALRPAAAGTGNCGPSTGHHS